VSLAPELFYPIVTKWQITSPPGPESPHITMITIRESCYVSESDPPGLVDSQIGLGIDDAATSSIYRCSRELIRLTRKGLPSTYHSSYLCIDIWVTNEHFSSTGPGGVDPPKISG
jgi:hypothetical protein